MKNLKRVTLLALISIMSISCGKDNSSGGSSSSSSSLAGVNSIITGAASGSTEAFSALLNWYQGSEQQLVQGQIETTYSLQSSNSQQGCWWIFCGSYSSGSSSNNILSQTRTCFSGQTSSVQRKTTTNINDYYCSSTGTTTTYTKASNADLQKLVTLNNGTWSVYQAQQSGSQITVLVGPKITTTTTNYNYGYNNPTATHVFTVNTQLHSAHNPVQVQDSTAGTTKVKQVGY